MTTLTPFLRVPDIGVAIAWYESIGFQCIGKHEDPTCGLDWAMMRLGEAEFMLYPHLENTVPAASNCGLYFNMDSIAGMKAKLDGKARIIEELAETEYGRKEITFHDCYGFQVTFSSAPD